MKTHSTWSYTPYNPPLFETGEIYICRIVPFDTAIHLEWLKADAAENYYIYCRQKGIGDFIQVGETENCCFDIEDLEKETDYEFYVVSGTKKSRVRLAKTGQCFFGSVVNYLHPDDKAYEFSGQYLCSPSFVRMPDGALVASMDLYRKSYPQNLTLIYRSEDDGYTWKYACELFPCFWGKLFVYRNDLYMLGCATEYGDLLIGKSTDGGRSFCEPVVLLRGSNGKNGETGVHKNPQPVIEYNGRIWNTLEWGSWGRGYHAAMVCSAEIGSDLMRAENWLFSEPVVYNPEWEGIPKGESSGSLEGCPVIGTDGKLYNIMRYQMETMTPNYGLALVYRVNTQDPEAPLGFQRVMEFPANHSKFEIKYDGKSDHYYTLASRILDREHVRSRNLLSLMRSKDLQKWEVVADILDKRESDPKQIGFQYVDFEIEETDILFLCRTSINGAHSFHDSNFSVFGRIADFRKL